MLLFWQEKSGHYGRRSGNNSIDPPCIPVSSGDVALGIPYSATQPRLHSRQPLNIPHSAIEPIGGK